MKQKNLNPGKDADAPDHVEEHLSNIRHKILIISGFGRDQRVESLLKQAKGQFVSKPFSPKELLSKVDEPMAQSR